MVAPEDTSAAEPAAGSDSGGGLAPSESTGGTPDLTSAADTSSTSDSSSDSGVSTDETNDEDSSTSLAAVGDDELLSIKKDALSDLSPLVDKLDQTPDEKFRTTMMMIQASDDQTLIKRAYDSAKEITDEKERAQALLDIVNEINYFTHTGSDDNK